MSQTTQPLHDPGPLTQTEPPSLRPLDADTWRARRSDHEARVDALLEPYLTWRRERGKHPVLDFLFEYYSFKPTRLRRWTPGVGVLLRGARPEDFPHIKHMRFEPQGAWLDTTTFPQKRLSGLRWIHGLLSQTRERPPHFGCHGLHEWAMVYRTQHIRHRREDLRLDPDELARFVDSHPVACTHYDAFRFFTPAARPLNRHQPTFDTMEALEQPGCLHTNMDLYKWSYKLFPWIAAELIVDAFELAAAVRQIDMRASPYDLAQYGLTPIAIETPQGRRQYREHQQALAQRAQPLRDRLIEAYDRFLRRHALHTPGQR